MEICALCRENKKLQISHVIPSFVGKWLKETSATGLLRGVIEPDKRVQDVGKMRLLCEDCEQRLSGLETYFANEVFYPFVERNQRAFKYDSRLLSFVISLSWRGLVAGQSNFKKILPLLSTCVDTAEVTWRNYLLGISKNRGPYEHHVFFFDYIEYEKGMPPDFQWYTLRTVDSTLLGNVENALMYTKFPWIMFVSAIQPAQLVGWNNTRIEEIGDIKPPQSFHDDLFGTFLLDRYNSILKRRPTQSKIDKRILKTLEKNSDRALKSKSLEVFLEESRRERNRRKEKLHPAVQSLIEIVEAATEDPNLPEKSKLYQKFDSHLLAESLSRVSGDEELKITSLMESTLFKARASGEDAQFVYDGKEFTLVFMVNLYYDQDRRGEMVSRELENQVNRTKEDKNRHFIVVSWNPFEPRFQYICEFHVDYYKHIK